MGSSERSLEGDSLRVRERVTAAFAQPGSGGGYRHGRINASSSKVQTCPVVLRAKKPTQTREIEFYDAKCSLMYSFPPSAL